MEKLCGISENAAVVFDSGIGGLNLLHACAVRRPDLRYYYVSDNANVPYGNRSAEEIYALTVNALRGIEDLAPAALVIGCNTVTARCIDKLRLRYHFPVIGIQPAVKQAAQVGGKCLVLATASTAQSPSFKNLFARFAPSDTEVVGSERLAEYIESNILSLPSELPRGLLPDRNVNSVVLGCTHYAYVKEQIKRRYNCPVFDGISGTADHFCDVLGKIIHFCPQTGNFDHPFNQKFIITFLKGDIVKNSHIFEYMFEK